MKYIRNFSEHSQYEAEMSKIPTPSVSYCRKENECHFMTNNVIMFKVGDLNGNTNQKVKVYYGMKSVSEPLITDEIPITEGNRWYVYSIPSGKSLNMIEGIEEITDTIISAKINSIFSRLIDRSYGNVSLIDCDISEMTSMYKMFDYCRSPQIFGIDNWNVSNITDMMGTFDDCHSLQNLDLSTWNVRNVTRMYSMFHNCESLQNLVGLSNWNVAKVDDMSMMFDSCYSLQNLDLSTWDVSSVIYMYQMFNHCSSLQVLYISGWDLTNNTNTNMEYMFNRCSSLKTIFMRGCNQITIDKIKAQLETDGILNNVTIITE